MGQSLLDIYIKSRETYFPRIPTNKTDTRKRIFQWICDNIELKGHDDVHDPILLSLKSTNVYEMSQRTIC